jgi:polysaccharide deacetylase family protein (PEP-CTERM system associated)
MISPTPEAIVVYISLTGMTHAFTVDVEDWFHGIPISDSARARFKSRLDIGLNSLLELLDSHSAKATFFVLGPIARTHAALIRRIGDSGHEIGCHGWSHEFVYRMSPSRFRDETRTAVTAIADVTGKPLISYRAAYFSVTSRSLWALDILAELGFRYDSSIFPIRNWRYGISACTALPHRRVTVSGPLVEFPIPVRRVAGSHVPVSGGAYFRIYPYWLTKKNMAAYSRDGAPGMFYIHPWELDPGHPRITFDRRAHFTHYINLRATHRKLVRLLADFKFTTLADTVSACRL